jgi:hypothetical protein
VWQVVLEALHLLASEVVGVELLYMIEKACTQAGEAVECRGCTRASSKELQWSGEGLYPGKELQWSGEGLYPGKELQWSGEGVYPSKELQWSGEGAVP